MRYFWTLLYGAVALIGGLFLFQNSTRVPSVDTNGFQLSLDLFVFGFGAKQIDLASLIASCVGVGFLLGLALPLAWKSFSAR